jgi:hypothetical protein
LGDYQHLTAAKLAVVNAISGTNTGDNATNSNYLAASRISFLNNQIMN